MKDQIHSSVTASEAKLHFGEILNKCVYGKQTVVIKKHDKPIAVIVSIEEWKQKKKEEEQEDPPLLIEMRKLRKRVKAYQKKNGIQPKKYSSVQWVKMVRKERDKKLDKIARGKLSMV